MAIESLLQDLINAVKENTAALTGGKASTATKSDAKADTKKTETKKNDDDGGSLDYEKDVKPMLLKTSEVCGRPKLIEIFEKFDVTKGDQLKAADYAKVLALCEKARKAKAEEDDVV